MMIIIQRQIGKLIIHNNRHITRPRPTTTRKNSMLHRNRRDRADRRRKRIRSHTFFLICDRCETSNSDSALRRHIRIRFLSANRAAEVEVEETELLEWFCGHEGGRAAGEGLLIDACEDSDWGRLGGDSTYLWEGGAGGVGAVPGRIGEIFVGVYGVLEGTGGEIVVLLLEGELACPG